MGTPHGLVRVRRAERHPTDSPAGGPAPLAVGATFRENMRLTGFTAEAERTVEELDPARVPAIRGPGPMTVGVTTRYPLAPEGPAATVRIDGTFSGGGRRVLDGGQAQGLGHGGAIGVAAHTRRPGDPTRPNPVRPVCPSTAQNHPPRTQHADTQTRQCPADHSTGHHVRVGRPPGTGSPPSALNLSRRWRG
ncbi:hypothetical protein GCM10027162_77790 [Streptomyces incanus]